MTLLRAEETCVRLDLGIYRVGKREMCDATK